MNNAVSLVPAEIWLKIAIYLRDYIPCSYGFPLVEKTPCYKEECGDIYLPDLYDLARTCRFLWKLLLPVVYHRVAFENGKTTWKNDMYMALGRQPALWQSVKEIRLYAGKGPMHQRHQDMIAILRPFRNLPAMRKLELKNVPFSASVIEGLMSATFLNTLIVGGGEWLWDVPHNWSQSRFGTHLRSLEVTSVAGDDFAPPRWMQLVVPSLCRLRVGNSTEGILIPLAAALKTRFVSLPNLKTFITVEVQETNVKIATFYVHSILNYLPQLEELFLGEHVNEVLEELSNDSLPALKFIGGHIFNRLMTKLVGRPGLEALQSNCRRWDSYTFPPQDAFRAENIKTLYWPESTWWEDTGEHLAKLFPNVEVLSLTACQGVRDTQHSDRHDVYSSSAHRPTGTRVYGTGFCRTS